MNLIPDSYRHSLDSGAYLRGVDSSEVGDRTPVDSREVGDAAVLLILGQSNGGNHGDVRHASARRVYNFNPFDGLFYPARDPLLGATGRRSSVIPDSYRHSLDSGAYLRGVDSSDIGDRTPR